MMGFASTLFTDTFRGRLAGAALVGLAVAALGSVLGSGLVMAAAHAAT